MTSLLSSQGDSELLSAESLSGSSFPTSTKGANTLTSKVSSVLSASYADTEFRDSLALLDERGLHSTAETRRQLRLELQNEVIESNGEIINEFAKVAHVRPAAILSDLRKESSC
jgi:conserved oligomeric Golgi complex subunit 6